MENDAKEKTKEDGEEHKGIDRKVKNHKGPLEEM